MYYENPAVEGRTGKLRSRAVILRAAVLGRKVEIKVHALGSVARHLGCTPSRVLQLVKSHKLKGYRLGRDWFVLDEDFRDFLRVQGLRFRERFHAYLSE